MLTNLMEADPSIVLEWLDSVNDELRELQLTALEQLCNEVLFSDNIDVFFERYPPRLFIPALCKVFLDELAPDSVLEANARALTYYLDVSLDCAPRIARSPNVLTAMTSRLDAVDMTCAKSNELGQQIVKMLQLICTREPGAVYAAGGLTSVLRYIRLYPHLLHADVLQAGMDIIRRLFTRADPRDTNLTSWINALSSLLDRRETGVADQALRAFANLVARFTRTGTDPSPLADPHIIDCLLQRLRVAGGVEADNELTDSSSFNLPTDTSGSGRDGLSSSTTESNPVAVHAVTNILTSLCCNSVSLTHKLLTNDGQFAMTLAMVIQRSTDELVVLSVLRLIEILLVLLYQTQNAQSNSGESSQLTEQVCKSTISSPVEDDILKQNQVENKLFNLSEFQSSVSIIEHAENSQNTPQSGHTSETSLEPQHSWEGDAVHRHFIEAIKRQDLDLMKRSLKSGKIDVNYMDHLGQTLLNWAASFGSPAMVELLCTHGANVNLGVRSPLDYAASFGRVEICRTLLNWGADINKQDAQGRKPIDRAREHPDFPGSHQVIDLLESESKIGLFKESTSSSVSLRLLHKSPHIYVLVFYRLGLIPLIQIIVDILNHLLIMENKSAATCTITSATITTTTITEKQSVEEQGVCEVVSTDSEGDNCMSEMLSAPATEEQDQQSILPSTKDGCLRVLCIHYSAAHRNSPVPIQLHPGENPIPRPGLKSRMLRMHQHLMELIDSNITITPLFKGDIVNESATENAGKQQTQLVSPKIKQLDILTHSSLCNLEASHNNARRFRKRLGLRHDPISIYTANSTPMTTFGDNLPKLQRQASSPARVCLPSRFLTKLPSQSISTNSSSDLLTSTTSVSFGSIICSLIKQKDGTYVSVKPRVSSTHTAKPLFNEALLLSENFCSGFKRVRIASTSREIPVTESNSTPHKASTNPNLFDSNITNKNLITTDFDERKSNKTDKLLAATSMELSRLDKLFFPSEIVHETYNSGQLVVLLRPEDDDSRPESAAERLILLRKHMLTLANRLLKKLQVDLSFSENISVSSFIIDKIGPANALNSVKQIVMQIWDIFKTDKNNTLNVTLNKLFTVFKKLSDLFHEGEQTITAYELTTSGLIQVLLLCLSIAHAGRWHCHEFSMKLDSTTALLWCLQERRRVFVQNMLSSSRSKSMSLLVRRLVQAFELTEHLPLRLFSAAHLSRSSPSANASEHNSSSNRKLAPDSEKTADRTQTISHAPAALMNKFGYSASLPINFINFSCNRHSTIYTDHGDSVSINIKQPFQDSMDAKELAALLRFCPILLDFPEYDLCLPNLHQIAKRLPLYLDKLSKSPLVPELNNNNKQDKLRDNNSKQLYNWRGKILFVSPLATVNQLERFLNRMYECSRVELSLWSQIDLANGRSKSTGLYFPAPPPGNSSADYLGGVIDWLATNGNRHPLEDWVNPAIVGLVSVAASTSNPVKGRAVSILGPQAGALVGGYTVRGSGIGVIIKPKRINSSTNGSGQSDIRGKKMGSNQKSGHTSSSTAAIVVSENETHAWIAIDLGLELVPTAYTLAYLRRADASEHSLAPRNWKLEASNDAISWIVLREHTNDSSIQSVSGSRATWGINLPDNHHHINDDVLEMSSSSSYTCVKQPTKGWRFFKIQTTGPNANGGKQLALGGFEFYGNVCSVYDSRIYSVSLSEKKDISATTTSSVSLNKKLVINNPNDSIVQSKIDHDYDNIEDMNEKSSSQSPDLNIMLSQSNQIDSGEHQKFNDGTIHNHDITSGLSPSQQQNVTDGGDDDEEQNIVDEDEEDGNSNEVNDRVDNNDDVDDDADHDDDDDDEDDNDDSGAVGKTAPENVLNNESSNDTFMNILFDEEAGCDDNVVSMNTTDRSDVDIILELSAKRLDDLNILSSGTVDDKFLRYFGNFLANDKSSPELCRLLRRIASQDIDFDLSNKCASRSMDSIHSKDDHQHSKMITYQSENAKRFDSVLDTGAIDISEPHISYIDQNNTETTGESDEYGLSYLVNSIEPEALEFADTVEAIIRSNTVQNRQNINDDDNNPIDLTTTNKLISTASSSSSPWKHFQLIQNNKSDKDKKSEIIGESTVFLSQSTLHGGLPVIKTISAEPCNSTEDTVDHNQEINEQHQSYKKTNETASFTASLSSDSSGFQVLPPSWKPAHQQFRRRVRRTRPRPVISSESKDLISSHSNSPHPSTPQVPLSWNEATDALRLPLGLIPAFIPNPGSTNAPGTTAYVLCRPPSNKPEFADDNNSYSPLSLFLGIYMNSEYLIQIPLRDKNATLFKYIQLLYQLPGLKEFYFNDINNDSDHTFLGDKSMKKIDENVFIDKNELFDVKMEYFTSTRLTNKLLRQIHDPLALASGALPNWCISLSQRFNVLFSYAVRSQLFSACAFGPARAVVWLQNRPLQKRTYVSHPDAYSRSGSAGSTSGRSSYRIILPSVNASLISALLNNTSATTSASANNTNGNHPLDDGASTSPNEDVVLLRPSILTHLLNIPSANSRAVNQNMNNVQQVEMNTVNNDFDTSFDQIPSFESILSNLGIPLPSTTTSSSLNCDTYLSGNIGGMRSTTTSNDLINCLLVHANNNDQHLTTSSATTATTPNGAGIGFSPDDRSTLQIGRLHKEFVRIPRLPHELLIQSANKCVKVSHTTYHNSDMLSMTFWHWASRLMEEHASRKSELEIQFIGEEGTGLGPTLEFYSLLAAELRRRDGLMWVTDDFSLAEQSNQSHSILPTVSSSTTIKEHVISSTGNHNYSPDSETDDIDEENIYVNTPHGLFPAPWPGDQVPESVLYRFFILGITVAKCLQDNRRIDLPLSPPLLKLLTAYGSVVIPSVEDADNVELKSSEPNQNHSTNCSIDKVDTIIDDNSVDFSVLSDVESAFQNLLYSCSYSTNQPVSHFCQFTEKEFSQHDETFNLASFLISPQYKRLYQCCRKRSDNNTLKTSSHWISGLLNLNDFCIIYPERAQFMRQIAEFHRRKFILLTRNANEKEISDLAVEIFGCDLDDLCISMEFLPPSKLFGFSSYPLKDVYHWESNSTNATISMKCLYENTINNSQSVVVPITVHNIEKYLELTLAFCLDKGVRKQLDAFKDGFQRVLPLRWLALFTGTELGQLISGDSVAQWTREDLLAYTVPSLGFTKQSPTYQMLINVLSSFNSNERRAFLQFTTGCSSLPPGGLKNLHPRLRIVRKEITNSGPYPSVNTCVHYLKLPEYQSEKELRTRLLQATKEIGFYLN
ncbi:E3 ubiquitin-protein ligase [Schistosoma japonicum]|nr:E3 ubiquitin-protein ligase [Schistosoma japonicum]